MAAQKGKNLKIKRGDGGTPTENFVLIAGMRSKSVRVSNSEIDVTTDDDVDASGVTWQTFLPGIVGFEVTGDGIAKDNAAMQQIIADSISGAQVNYQIEVVDVGTFAGPMSVFNLEVSGNHDDAVQFSASWRARAAVTFTPA